MKYILSGLILIFSLSTCAQGKITVEEIDKEFYKTIQDTSLLKRKIVPSIIEPGVLDTVKVYFKDDKVKYICYKKHTIGLASVDNHYKRELLYINEKLVLIRTLSKWDYFDKGFTLESKTKAEEQLGYLDLNGDCLKYFEEREAIGTRATVMKELKKVPLKEKDCIYCSYDESEGDEYLQKIK